MRRSDGFSVCRSRSVSQSLNAQGGFGVWEWDVSFDPEDWKRILAKHNREQ